MSMSDTARTGYDVIVAGAGPAGIATAINIVKLAPSMRDRILVLEKESHPRKKICGGALSAWADSWLRRLAVEINIPSLELSRIRYIIDHDSYVEYDVLLEAGVRMVIREDFDTALVRIARNRGIQVEEREPMVSFSRENDGIQVHTPRRRLETKILVGADGSRSVVRSQLNRDMGLRGPEFLCSALRLMVPVEEKRNPEHRDLEAIIDFSTVFRHGMGGYTWSGPVIISNRPWLNTGIVCFRNSSSPETSLKQVFEDFLSGKGLCLEKSRLEGCPIRSFHPSSTFSAKRVLLVGDAAGVDPLWGEGISFCLGYGEVAAQAILNATESKDFSFQTYREELLRHEVGQELMHRLNLAEKLYRPQGDGNQRDLLRSVLFHPS